MPLNKIISISGKAVPVPGADMDTDRIIPARFLKCVTFDELAGPMLYDARVNEDGRSTGRCHHYSWWRKLWLRFLSRARPASH